jgi:hypothetical protein
MIKGSDNINTEICKAELELQKREIAADLGLY